MGMNAITALQGVRVCSSSDVRFGENEVQASEVAASVEKDFKVTSDVKTKKKLTLQ